MAKIWNQEEIDYLYDNVGMIKIDTIAKNLNRPVDGVELKMKRLNIGNTKEHLGLLTMGALATLLQVDRTTVKHWVDKQQLPVVKRKTRKIKTFYFIEPIEFWSWAFHHQDRIDFSKLELNAIPPEPEWVKPLRYQERKIKGNYYRSWTTKEEKLILELKEKGKTYKSIAKVLDRTPLSIEKKYKRLTKQSSVVH